MTHRLANYTLDPVDAIEVLDQLARQVREPIQISAPVIARKHRAWVFIPGLGYFHGDHLRECVRAIVQRFVEDGQPVKEKEANRERSGTEA